MHIVAPSCCCCCVSSSPMAQSVARQAVNLQVAGSNPAGGDVLTVGCQHAGHWFEPNWGRRCCFESGAGRGRGGEAPRRRLSSVVEHWSCKPRVERPGAFSSVVERPFCIRKVEGFFWVASPLGEREGVGPRGGKSEKVDTPKRALGDQAPAGPPSQ
eukprot:gene9139-biopygen6187